MHMDAWVLPFRDSNLIGSTQVSPFKKERMGRKEGKKQKLPRCFSCVAVAEKHGFKAVILKM